jgi:hypothetical protein
MVKSGVHPLFSAAFLFKAFAFECRLFRDPPTPAFFRGTSYLAGVSAFKIGKPVGLAEAVEEGLRTINEQRWRHKKQSLTRRHTDKGGGQSHR